LVVVCRMDLRQSDSKRIVHAPAKLNLFLDVLDRRGDGYHELATLMVPLRLQDSLSLVPTPPGGNRPASIEFSLEAGRWNDGVPADSSNLVVRALELLRRRSGCDLGAQVTLMKRIPTAAGLGGGSSDAAAALRMANRAWGLDWELQRLASLAAELGSDVPFFLEHGAAICRGRGELVERIAAVPLHVVIVKPPVALSTAEVYRCHDRLSADVPHPAGRSDRTLTALAKALRRGTIQCLGEWMGNRLQVAAAALSGWIGEVQAAFAGLDFVGHQLSGSGSAYFGVCRHARHARRLAAILRQRQLGLVYVTRSCN
jgi:4-diphosphocytidyl-2-C-methyl-D-erythritol kinase